MTTTEKIDQTHDAVLRIEAQVNNISMRLEDHETRIRNVERVTAKSAGGIKMLSYIGTAVLVMAGAAEIFRTLSHWSKP